jgi:glucose/arabinose dehydrogenase
MPSESSRTPTPRRARQELLWLLFAALLVALGVVARNALRGQPALAAGSDLGPAAALDPTYQGADERRTRIAVRLQPIASGIEQPTDIQFPDGMPGFAVVLSKTGTAHWLRLDNGTHGELFKVDVLVVSEEGLLGITFHPKFESNRRFFINYVAKVAGKDTSRVAEWRMDGDASDLAKAKPKFVRVLMDVEQPYPNHDAGALTFGPDGYLYVGWGDGGAGGDPHGHGQNGRTWLGSMLRIDVDKQEAGKPYAIPKDNPFLGKDEFLPETWAYGLRNPWRYSFDPKGRLIVADVGQNKWEEIDIVRAGDNLGWSIKEGFACFTDAREKCNRKDLVDPVLVYGRDDGVSITGGYVYTGKSVPSLQGLYVFGDFGSGRLFAMRLPEDRAQRVAEPIALGRFTLAPSTFGRDPNGELYVGDYARGIVHRVVAPP